MLIADVLKSVPSLTIGRAVVLLVLSLSFARNHRFVSVLSLVFDHSCSPTGWEFLSPRVEFGSAEVDLI